MNKLTNAQKEYFKDSVIRDKSGDLLKVYHGSPLTFDSFDKEFIGKMNGEAGGSGFNFTDNKETAEFYMQNNNFKNANPMLVECYLNITNPITSDGGITIPKERMEDIIYSFASEYEDAFGDKKDEVIDNLISATNKYYEEHSGNGAFDSDIGLLNCFRDEFIKSLSVAENLDEFVADSVLSDVSEENIDYYYTDSFVNDLSTKIVPMICDEYGYDGTVGTSFGGGHEYVCFEPNQIKAIDNLYPTKDDNFIDNSEDYFKNASLDERIAAAEEMAACSNENKETKAHDDLEL